MLINDDTDEAYDLFQSTLLTVFTDFLIMTKNVYSCVKGQPLITPGTCTSCYSQETTPQKKGRQNPEPFFTEYHRQRNLLTKVTRTAREPYYHNLLESSFEIVRKVWFYINTMDSM